MKIATSKYVPNCSSREAVDESKGNTRKVKFGPDVRSHGKLADKVVLD